MGILAGLPGADLVQGQAGCGGAAHLEEAVCGAVALLAAAGAQQLPVRGIAQRDAERVADVGLPVGSARSPALR